MIDLHPRLPVEPSIEEMLAWFDVNGWLVTIEGGVQPGFTVAVGDSMSRASFRAGPRSLAAALRDVYYKARGVGRAERDAWNAGDRG